MGIPLAAAFITILACIAVIAFLVKRMKDMGKEADQEIKKAEERYRTLFEFTREGLVTTDSGGKILASNSAAAEMLGFDRPEDIAGKGILEFYRYPEQRNPLFEELMKTGYMENYLLTLKKKDGAPLYVMCSDIIRRDSKGNISEIWTSFMNITRQKNAEDDVHNAQLEARYCQEEKTAFINSVRAVSRYDNFGESLRAVFGICKDMTGARAGYVALANEERTGDTVVLLDSGSFPLMPVSGMHGEIYRTGKPIYLNDFPKTEGSKQLPDHARPDNVLLVPVIKKSEIIGVLCLANKLAGFTGNDARLAFIFSEIIAIAFLMNSSRKG